MSHDEFERLLAAMAADAAFAQIRAHVATLLKVCLIPVGAAEHARAAAYLRDASMGRRPWATSPAPSPPPPAAIAPLTAPGPAPALASAAASALAAICVLDAVHVAGPEPQSASGGVDGISALASIAAAVPALALLPAKLSPGAAAAFAVAADG